MNNTKAIKYLKLKLEVNKLIGFSGEQNEVAEISIKALQENEQLRELVRLAVEDMKYCNNCNVCKFKDCHPSCKSGSFGCGLECKCCQCLHESNFTWQHADKLKGLIEND